MAYRYKYARHRANGRICEGVHYANGMFYVEDGMDETFRDIPFVRKGMTNGDIKFVGSDDPPAYLGDQGIGMTETHVEAEPKPPTLSYRAAYQIAEAEYHIPRAELKDLIDGGLVEKAGNRLATSEAGFRDKLEAYKRDPVEVEPEPAEEETDDAEEAEE